MRAQRKAHVVVAVTQGAQRDHARRPRRRRGHLADRHPRRLGNVDGLFAPGGVPAVKAFIDANPITADFGKTWDNALPPAVVLGSRRRARRGAAAGLDAQLSACVERRGGPTDTTYFAQWERTPFADAYVGRFAAALVQSLQLGKHEGTDVLAISFSTPDLVGHAFGPRSHEVQDIYAHLDKTHRCTVRSARRPRRQGSMGRRAERRSRRDADSRAGDRRGQGRRPHQRRRARRCDRAGAEAGVRPGTARHRAQHQRHLFRSGRLRQDPEIAAAHDLARLGHRSRVPGSSVYSAAKRSAAPPSRAIRCCVRRR